MRISSGIKSFIPVSLLAVVLALNFSASAYAESAVRITEGTVGVDEDGTVWVCVLCEPDGTRQIYVPSNGHGLFQSGQIGPGDKVGVRIVQDKKQKHRGHVTVLK